MPAMRASSPNTGRPLLSRDGLLCILPGTLLSHTLPAQSVCTAGITCRWASTHSSADRQPAQQEPAGAADGVLAAPADPSPVQVAAAAAADAAVTSEVPAAPAVELSSAGGRDSAPAEVSGGAAATGAGQVVILPVPSQIEAPVNIQVKAVQVGVGLAVGALTCLCPVIPTMSGPAGACLSSPSVGAAWLHRYCVCPDIGGSMTKLLVWANAARHLHRIVCTAAPHSQLQKMDTCLCKSRCSAKLTDTPCALPCRPSCGSTHTTSPEQMLC